MIGYRKKVISENLNIAFANGSLSFKASVTKQFYTHLSDLIVEGIKAFTISNKQIRKRYHVKGSESTFADFDKGKDIIVVSAHYGNWEWASLACPLYLKHQCAVIVTPLSDPFMNQKISKSRGRNGYDLVPKSEVKSYMQKRNDKPRAIFFLCDQSPSNPDRAYWTSFLGTETPVQYGVEKYAREYNMPLYYIHVERTKRGIYDVEVAPLISDPDRMKEGEIVESVTRHIETKIISNPNQWLWSHRRWKHKKKKG